MPRMSGFEVLERIRADEGLRHLPVVVLTSSGADEDKRRAWDLGVNAYIVRPVRFERFAEALRIISRFWELAETPDGI